MSHHDQNEEPLHYDYRRGDKEKTYTYLGSYQDIDLWLCDSPSNRVYGVFIAPSGDKAHMSFYIASYTASEHDVAKYGPSCARQPAPGGTGYRVNKQVLPLEGGGTTSTATQPD